MLSIRLDSLIRQPTSSRPCASDVVTIGFAAPEFERQAYDR